MPNDHKDQTEKAESGHTPEQVAPWLVLLSQHLPIPMLDEAGWPDGVMCSCGSALYVGHLPGLIVDKVEELARRQSDNGETCHRGAQALRDAADDIEMALDHNPDKVRQTAVIDYLRRRADRLTIPPGQRP